jgi:NAD(P)-dependent dehydrogenase (short-subunit alcohol dehydrogenase family)
MDTGKSGLEGRAAVVTGASRGIGLAIAETLVRRGAQVCITGRDAAALEAAVDGLCAAGPGSAIGVAGKADDPEHAAAAVAETLEVFGRLDMLVNNAGVNPVYGPTLEAPPAALRKIFEVNVFAALEWTRRAHAAWMGEHGGAVVNIASIGGLRATHGIGLYGVSKAALIALTTQLGAELAPAVRVNAVAPAVVKTRMASVLYEGREEAVAEGYPMRRLGVPDDVAGAVAFLLSDEAAWITGQTLVIDGGLALGVAGGLE